MPSSPTSTASTSTLPLSCPGSGESCWPKGALTTPHALAAPNLTHDLGITVVAEDADTAIFADAEGTGSQGRSFEEPGAEERQAPETSDNGISKDEDGQLHLDIEA